MKKSSPKQAAPIPKERFLHQIQRSPFMDWLVILGVSALIFLVLVGVGVSVYLDTGAQLSNASSDAPGPSKQALNSAALQGILAGFDARAAEHAALAKSYSAPKDPSLP